MSRDSGLIDLFAIHREEEARVSSVPVPSAPPPAVAMDVGSSGLYGAAYDDDIEGFAAAQLASKKRMKLVGGIVGAVSVVGLLIAGIAIGSGSAKSAPTATAAATEPPAAAAPAPPPAADPIPPPAAAPVPAPPATGAAGAKAKNDYTPATASAAYAVQQAAGKKKSGGGAAPFKVGKGVGGGVKMTKIQSSGVAN